jgi:hypothetical protein
VNKIITIVLFLFFIGQLPVKAQFTESKERKKMWRKSAKRHKAREAYNPYLDKIHYLRKVFFFVAIYLKILFLFPYISCIL